MASGPRPPASKIIFNKYDSDKDGLIDIAEFHFMAMDLGYKFTEEEEKFAVMKIDQSGSGKIKYEDFAEFWKTDDRWEGLRLEDDELMQLSMLLTEFQAFDGNDDGVIDRAEFAEMYESLQAGGVEKDIDTVMAELDVTSSGTIAFNGYVDWLKKNAEVRVKLGAAAHAAATARANEFTGTGVEVGAEADEVCPPTVVVEEKAE